MLIRTQKNISVSQLKPAAHNPANRMQAERLQPLKQSLAKDGQLVPILVDRNNVIIDGHRRWAAAKLLGLGTLEAIVIDQNPNRVYAIINSTSKRLNGNDLLGIWLKNPLAVSFGFNRRMEMIEPVLGRPLLEELYRKGMTLHVYYLTLTIIRACGHDGDAKLTIATVKWFIKFAMVRIVINALKDGQTPQVILKAVKEDKPLKLRLAIPTE